MLKAETHSTGSMVCKTPMSVLGRDAEHISRVSVRPHPPEGQTMLIPKNKPQRSKKHLAFIRTMNCCVCGKHPVEAAHIRHNGNGGMGLKNDDSMTVPLCPDCHRLQGNFGEKRFWGKQLELAKHLAKELSAYSGNADKCTMMIMKFRLSP